MEPRLNINMHNVCRCSSRPLTTCIFPAFDTLLLLIYSATYPGWFCSAFYAEIPIVVVESEIPLLTFAR